MYVNYVHVKCDWNFVNATPASKLATLRTTTGTGTATSTGTGHNNNSNKNNNNNKVSESGDINAAFGQMGYLVFGWCWFWSGWLPLADY